MSYQFGHIEGYARSSKKSYSIHDVCKEAERVPGYCDHVKNPMPPTIIHGCTPSEAVEMAETWAEQAKDVSGRKLRIDAPVMLAGVLSYPRDGQHWDLFREQAVGWLRGKYGDRLVSVIEHQDEEHPHLHFYCVPLPGEDFDLLHEGRAASAKVKRDTAAAKGQHHASQMRLAYNTAMKGWQDELHAGVGIYLGLARMGPKRQGKGVGVSLEVVICTAIDWVDSLALGDRVGNLGGASYGGSVQSADLPVSVAFLAEPDFPGFSLTALAHLCGQHAASPGRFGFDNGAWCQQRLDRGNPCASR